MSETFAITVAGVDAPLSCRDDQTILDAALISDLPLPYQCRSGECGNCIATVTAGSVHEMPGADPAVFGDRDRQLGRILTCNSLPATDLTIEIPLRDGSGAAPVETINAMVDAIEWVTPTIAAVELSIPWPVRYAAGQYFEWVLPGIAPNRNFSAANASGTDRLCFHVRDYAGGQVSTYVRNTLYPGEIVQIIGPYGRFGWSAEDGSAARSAICIAGGTGLAPIRAMLEEHFASGGHRAIRFFYGARSGAELYCLQEMAEWADAHDDFAFIPVLEDPTGSPVMAQAGRVTDALTLELGTFQSGKGESSEAFLCGPPAMIDAAIEILVEAGVAQADIHFDKFVPAKTR